MKKFDSKSAIIGGLLTTIVLLSTGAIGTRTPTGQEWLVERAHVLEQQGYLSVKGFRSQKGGTFFPFRTTDGWEPFAYQARSGTQQPAVLYRKRIQ